MVMPVSDSDDMPMLGMALPAAVPAPDGIAYRVLARKYRPQTFAELIGQDAMVQTLANAIRRNRLAHAFLMTGVRGVGKTSTARLIAKGLNCVGRDGQGGPTIDPCGVCDPCVAIAEGRHIDVIEMDAASHTGVDDVREIIEAVRYATVSARFKIYIIDEVHMLSKSAFNALLKTLEEPPPHVKFLFATTEVAKVPVTVLSRCQRFDLRRISPALLFDHYRAICEAEAVEAEDDALRLIAAAAEGSVRDGLSMLDQAMSYAEREGDERITEAQVRQMLGLSDGTATRALLDHLLAGDAKSAIAAVHDHHALGAEPVGMVRSLLALVHGIALRRVTGVDDLALAADDRAAIAAWADQVGPARAHRLWQMLLKASEEVARAADPLAALDMAMLRIAHAGTMPDPDDLARLLANRDALPSTAPQEPAAPPPAASSDGPTDLGEVVDLLRREGQRVNASLLEQDGRVVSLTSGAMALQRGSRIGEPELAAISSTIARATGQRWDVTLSDAAGTETLQEKAEAAARDAEAVLRRHPVVAAALAAFPQAEIIPTNRPHGA